jgi:hypothetical protein
MNYYVISPNVYKDGIFEYLKEMEDRHIAIMGWGKKQSRQGTLFSKMQINDRVIIAHGANRNKRVYFAGIVASEKSMSYNGESQYVELYNFKDIRSYKILFTENNTYGASNQIPSIYELKEDTDKNIIEAIERILSIKSFNIRDVEFWAKYPNRYISIPSLQRGLVWKPRQVELLWDSILRNFPIGSFMLSEIPDENECEQSLEEKQYYLIDGQQRFNAIALGYNAYSEENPNSIVWFDLHPDVKTNSTRKYWVKLTTKSHPWGYKNDDECSTLSAPERREALTKFGIESIYKQDFDLKQTYPTEAKFPIPLYWLLKAPTMDPEVFTEWVLREFEDNKINRKYRIPFETIDDKITELLRKDYYDCFRRLKQYTINVNLLSSAVVDEETESENSGIADIEILFNRIGAGGTPISEGELIYSAIKAYWPKEVKEKNDVLAAKYMPPVTLIMLAFRLSLTSQEDTSFKGNPSIWRIRQIAKEKGDLYYKIIDFYKIADGLLKKVDSWLTLGDVPKIIRTGMARRCPDLYLLLIFLAQKNIINNEENEKFIQALAYYIYWFRKDNGTKCVNIIFANIKEATSDNIRSKVVESLLVLIQGNLLEVLYEPNYISSAFGDVKKDPNWRPGSNNNSSNPWWPIWNIICNNRDLLLYAQRTYLDINFSRYDPAKLDMWEEHNRPWDYDHIIPQDWIHLKNSRRKEYTNYCEAWLNYNGNLAAIPFEKNRGKSNHAEWDEYINNKELLLCDDEIEKFGDLFDNNIQNDPEQAYRFAVKTKERTIQIYQDCYNILSRIFEHGIFELVGSNTKLLKRKRIIESLLPLLKDILNEPAQVLFTFNEEEYKIEQELEWAMSELTVGIIIGNMMPCVYFQDLGDEGDYKFWVGIGKAPNSSKNEEIQLVEGYQKPVEEWWYINKELGENPTVEEIADEIKNLVEHVNRL